MSKLILLKWLEMCFLLNNWFLSGNNQSCSYNAHLHILIMNLLQFKFQFSLLVMLFTVRGPRSQFFPDDSALDTVTRRDCPSGWVRKMGDLVAHIWPVLGLAVAHDHWPLAVIYSDGDYILLGVLISVIEKVLWVFSFSHCSVMLSAEAVVASCTRYFGTFRCSDFHPS